MIVCAYLSSMPQRSGDDRESEMYQVTAMYEEDEVGYGEGESFQYAARECFESEPVIYPDDAVKMICTHGAIKFSIPLDLYISVVA